MRKLVFLALVTLVAGACGDNAGTAPTPQIPNVSGNYSGTTRMVLPELNSSVTCPTTTSVSQSGSNISVAPLVMAGECGGMSIPLGSTTIDATGSLGQSSGTHREACGLYNWAASGGFFGRELRLSMTATSTTCWNMNMTITVTR